MKRHFINLLALVLPLFIFLQTGQAEEVNKPRKEIHEGVAAMVNGISIPLKALEPEVNRQLAKFKRNGMRGQASPEYLLLLKKRALSKLIDQEVLRQAVTQVDVPDAAKKAEERLAGKKASFDTPERFARFLKARNLTEEKLLESYRNQLQMEVYQKNSGISSVEPTEGQIADFYERGKENFKQEEMVKARHILILVDQNASDEIKREKRKKAEEIRAELVKNPSLFPQLAKEFSDCNQSKDRGGELNYIKKGYMPPEFDSLAFTLPIDEISEVIETQYGFHIIQVMDKKLAGIIPLENIHDFIKEYLKGEMAAKKMDEHIAELRKKADIKIYLQ